MATNSRFSLSSTLRKWGPVLFFLLLGGVMLFGQQMLLAVTTFVNGADVVTATGANADGGAVLANAQAGGWVQVGAVTSKLVTAGGAFIWVSILVWRMQQLTSPRPTEWAKSRYSTEFNYLGGVDKFNVYQASRWQLIALACAALIFAAVVQ